MFQDREDAERFRREVDERLAAFELHVASEKTAVLLFDGNLLQGAGRPTIKRATVRRPCVRAVPFRVAVPTPHCCAEQLRAFASLRLPC